jgi:hypothetical protein
LYSCIASNFEPVAGCFGSATFCLGNYEFAISTEDVGSCISGQIRQGENIENGCNYLDAIEFCCNDLVINSSTCAVQTIRRDLNLTSIVTCQGRVTQSIGVCCNSSLPVKEQLPFCPFTSVSPRNAYTCLTNPNLATCADRVNSCPLTINALGNTTVTDTCLTNAFSTSTQPNCDFFDFLFEKLVKGPLDTVIKYFVIVPLIFFCVCI